MAFAQHCGATFPMLSDFNHGVIGPYGVEIEEVMGHRGIAARAAFVVGPGRRVRYAWYAPNLGTLPDPEEALAAVRAST
jgi:peroxiredoxin